jgi:hypothetical protein
MKIVGSEGRQGPASAPRGRKYRIPAAQDRSCRIQSTPVSSACFFTPLLSIYNLPPLFSEPQAGKEQTFSSMMPGGRPALRLGHAKPLKTNADEVAWISICDGEGRFGKSVHCTTLLVSSRSTSVYGPFGITAIDASGPSECIPSSRARSTLSAVRINNFLPYCR